MHTAGGLSFPNAIRRNYFFVSSKTLFRNQCVPFIPYGIHLKYKRPRRREGKLNCKVLFWAHKTHKHTPVHAKDPFITVSTLGKILVIFPILLCYNPPFCSLKLFHYVSRGCSNGVSYSSSVLYDDYAIFISNIIFATRHFNISFKRTVQENWLFFFKFTFGVNKILLFNKWTVLFMLQIVHWHKNIYFCISGLFLKYNSSLFMQRLLANVIIWDLSEIKIWSNFCFYLNDIKRY